MATRQVSADTTTPPLSAEKLKEIALFLVDMGRGVF